MSILFPLILVPTYFASNGDPLIFYSTTAGVLSGSVAGDHMSPISDTTVITSLACDCDLLAHVVTQAPYALTISLLSILVGTLPIGYDAWPNMIGYLIGWALTVLFAVFFCKAAVNKNGAYDMFMELYLKCKKTHSPLEDLRHDAAEKYESYDGKDPNAINWRFWQWRCKKEKFEEFEEEDMNEKDEMGKGPEESMLADDELFVKNESLDDESLDDDDDKFTEREEPDPNKASIQSEYMS